MSYFFESVDLQRLRELYLEYVQQYGSFGFSTTSRLHIMCESVFVPWLWIPTFLDENLTQEVLFSAALDITQHPLYTRYYFRARIFVHRYCPASQNRSEVDVALKKFAADYVNLAKGICRTVRDEASSTIQEDIWEGIMEQYNPQLTAISERFLDELDIWFSREGKEMQAEYKRRIRKQRFDGMFCLSRKRSLREEEEWEPPIAKEGETEEVASGGDGTASASTAPTVPKTGAAGPAASTKPGGGSKKKRN